MSIVMQIAKAIASVLFYLFPNFTHYSWSYSLGPYFFLPYSISEEWHLKRLRFVRAPMSKSAKDHCDNSWTSWQ